MFRQLNELSSSTALALANCSRRSRWYELVGDPSADWIRLALAHAALMAVAAITAASSADGFAGSASIAASLLLTVSVSLTQRRRLLVAGLITVLGTVDGALALIFGAATKGVLLGIAVPAAAGTHLLSGNVLAYLLLPAPLAACAILFTRSTLVGRVAWSAVACAGVIVVALTGSRASFLGLAFGLASLVVALMWRRRHRLLGAALLSSAIAISTGTWIAQTGEASVVNRLVIWQQLIDSPRRLWGVGYGGFAHLQDQSPVVVTASGVPHSAHNLVLQTLLDFGPFGLLLVASIVTIGLIRAGRVVCASRTNADQLAMALIAISAAVGLAVVGAFESILSTAIILPGDVPITVFSPIPLLTISASAGIMTSGSGADVIPRQRASRLE